MPLNININWNDLAALCRRIALANKTWENTTHIPHEYERGQKVILILTAHERRSQRKIDHMRPIHYR